MAHTHTQRGSSSPVPRTHLIFSYTYAVMKCHSGGDGEVNKSKLELDGQRGWGKQAVST